VIFERDRAMGHNTDGRGFIASLEEEGICPPAGKDVIVLGAGGAARAICVELLKVGVRRLVIANRTTSRATSLAEHLSSVIPAAVVEIAELNPSALKEPVDSAAMVINTTSVGMGGGALPPLPWGAVRPDHIVCDIIYRPLKTSLLEQAEAKGCRTVNGLGMLIHQGNLSFKLWTGQEFPLSVVRRALLSRLEGGP